MDGLAQDTDLIRRLVAFAKTNPAAVAKRAGVAVTTINRPYTGTSPSRIGRAVLEKLRAAFPDFPDWAQSSLPMPTKPANIDDGGDGDEVEIDSIDQAYGMGGTFVDLDQIEVSKLRFSRTWLRKFTHAPPELIFATSGSGDSMTPTIHDQDIVIVDRSVRPEDVMGEKIWAIVYGGVGMIKRLRPMPDGTVKIFSDNTSFPPELATDGDLFIVGRVVASVRRH